ncbi:MAG: TraR/DksA C4-type zinc finger protein [Candidatus Paceibacterota bacterium]|nr:hypothetical protein [Candidatus Saccharibacteria bacterium]
MNTKQYQQALEDEQHIVVAELRTLGVENPENPGDWITTSSGVNEADENVVADRTEDWAARRATLALLETRYKNIIRALNKIEAGTYGTCEICNNAIETARLDANPAARTCKTHLEAEGELEN